MTTTNKSLLVRADFVLGNRRGGDRLMCKRWRRALADALPRLLGCADRRPLVRVRLHEGEGEARFTGWLRIPIERRPSRRRLRKFKAKLRARLEAGLLPVDGEVLKLGVRRCQPHPVREPDLFSTLRESLPLALPAPEVTVPAEPLLPPPALEAALPASLQSL
jgi:hypothetical protein